jgi:hypothetical protein
MPLPGFIWKQNNPVYRFLLKFSDLSVEQRCLAVIALIDEISVVTFLPLVPDFLFCLSTPLFQKYAPH